MCKSPVSPQLLFVPELREPGLILFLVLLLCGVGRNAFNGEVIHFRFLLPGPGPGRVR